MQLLREREELKYSAEEKIVEDSEESEEDETVKKSVAERREQIQKRLSIERQIPASTQKKEIVQEITAIKRQSLIEDKKALHEEEIIMHAPTDNIIKSTSIPEQIIKLKSTVFESPDVSKTDFDKELQDKFKSTIKGIEDFEHKTSDDLQTQIHQHTVEIESSKSHVDSKIHIDHMTTEKSSSPDKYTQELITEKTRIADETSEAKDSVKKIVTKIESTPSNEFVKTVEETAKQTSDIDQKILIDNKLSTQRVIEKPNEIGETQKFLEHETESTEIVSQTKEKIDSDESRKTTSIIDVTRQFLEAELTGGFSGQSDIVVSDVIVEHTKDATKTGDSITTAKISKESKIVPLIDPELSAKLEKQREKVEIVVDSDQPEIKVSKDVFTKDTNEDEFFKTINEKITKKMSQDLTINQDDIASFGMYKSFFELNGI